MGIGNTCANIPGIVAPIVVANITTDVSNACLYCPQKEVCQAIVPFLTYRYVPATFTT